MQQRYDYLIVGGGIAGVTAAEAIRGKDARSSVAIVSTEPHLLYSRVMLPHYVKGQVSREKLFLRQPKDFAANNIEFLAGEPVRRLLSPGNRVLLKSGREVQFGKLLVASGGVPRQLRIPGHELRGVSRFQTLADADEMVALLADTRSAVVIGGGFIVLEYLEILSRRKIPAVLVMRGKHVFPRSLDSLGARLLHENFRVHGIGSILTRDELVALEGSARVRRVRTAEGRIIPCDFIGVGIGLRKSIAWLAKSGVETEVRGVKTNEYLEAARPGVFAAGDVAVYPDVVLERRHTHGNWTSSFLQGEIAGLNMAGERKAFTAISHYTISNLGFLITFVGEAREKRGVRTITRADLGQRRYERLFLRGDRIIGAVLINRPASKPIVTQLIGRYVPVGDHLAELRDPGFDLAALL